MIFYMLPGSISDPFHGFMMWIRIRICPNDTDPTGAGSTTLQVNGDTQKKFFFKKWKQFLERCFFSKIFI